MVPGPLLAMLLQSIDLSVVKSMTGLVQIRMFLRVLVVSFKKMSKVSGFISD